MTKQLSFRVANDLGQIRGAKEQVDEFGKRNDLSPDVVFAVKLSIEELLVNTISYGYSDQKTHMIDVRIQLRGSRLRMKITDDAVGFDPRDANEPDTAAALKDRQIGGLGIHLVRELMDSIEYRREGGRNHLTLTKELQK